MNIFEWFKEEQSTRHRLKRLIHQGEKIMATLDEVKAEVSTLGSAVAAAKAASAAQIQTLSDQVTALQAQLAAGTGVTSADLDALLASIKGVEAAV